MNIHFFGSGNEKNFFPFRCHSSVVCSYFALLFVFLRFFSFFFARSYLLFSLLITSTRRVCLLSPHLIIRCCAPTPINAMCVRICRTDSCRSAESSRTPQANTHAPPPEAPNERPKQRNETANAARDANNRTPNANRVLCNIYDGHSVLRVSAGHRVATCTKLFDVAYCHCCE